MYYPGKVNLSTHILQSRDLLFGWRQGDVVEEEVGGGNRRKPRAKKGLKRLFGAVGHLQSLGRGLGSEGLHSAENEPKRECQEDKHKKEIPPTAFMAFKQILP